MFGIKRVFGLVQLFVLQLQLDLVYVQIVQQGVGVAKG